MNNGWFEYDVLSDIICLLQKIGVFVMDDKILKTKKEIMRIIKANKLTRFEKYNLVKEKTKVLNEEEMKILIKECHRDYESYDRTENMKELISTCLTGFGLIIATLGILWEDTIKNVTGFMRIVGIVSSFIVFLILLLSGIQMYRSNNMNTMKYILDILEE